MQFEQLNVQSDSKLYIGMMFFIIVLIFLLHSSNGGKFFVPE